MEKIIELTKQDCDDLLESLKYTLLAKEDYQKYPSYEYKIKTVAETQSLIGKINNLKKQL